jgi:hypothetical protein
MAENMDHLGQNFGEYRLLRKLGGGGFGTVYLGEHVRDQTLAAVKVLHARLTDPIELKEFINEARTIRLKHPNIVSLLDFGIGADDAPFLIMENAPYGTLRTRHPKGWQVPLATVIEYVNPIASALQYAHNLNLVHRDVKPENMLIGADNQILLSDFGFSTVAFNTYSSEGQNTVSGTIPYMAPEQFEGKAGAASDQYALAVVVYEWLSGSCPFKGTATEVAVQHSQANPPSLCEKMPYLSREVERVVMTALAKDPKQRFASVQDFVDALETVGQTTGRIVALPSITVKLATNKIDTKGLVAYEGAVGTKPTRVVLKPQPVDVVAPVLAQLGSASAVVVAQTSPSIVAEAVRGRSVFSKRKTITVAGLALTLLVVALLLMGSFTSGARAGVKSVPGLAVSTTIISTTTIPSTAILPIVPSPGKTVTPLPGKTVVLAPGKTAAPHKPTVSPPTPIVLLPTPTPIVLPTPTPIVAPLPTPTPIVLPSPTPKPLGIGSVRIDSGGSGVGLFVGDEYFSNITPGRPSSTSNYSQSVIDTSGVSNPAPQSVYQTFRYGDCLYTIPHLTPYASYTIRLHFAETYWTQAGKRVFNVTLNGRGVLSNFDIFAAAGGENKAVVEQFVVQADSTGTIAIRFQTVKDNAQINAIEVLAS